MILPDPPEVAALRTRIDELLAESERADAEADKLYSEATARLNDARAKLAEAEAGAAAMREALTNIRGYAFHSSRCPSEPPGGDDAECNCDYTNADYAVTDALSLNAGRDFLAKHRALEERVRETELRRGFSEDASAK